jgi:hypothetical protein
MRITPLLRTLILGFGICVTEAAFIVSESFEVVVALLSGAEGLLLFTSGLDQRGVKRLVVREDMAGELWRSHSEEQGLLSGVWLTF